MRIFFFFFWRAFSFLCSLLTGLLQKMGLLIVNADDYGIRFERDRGIEEAFVKGCVSSATMLLAGDSASLFPQTEVSPRIPLGLHMNLTEGDVLPLSTFVQCPFSELVWLTGVPIAGVEAVPSLVGPDGRMWGKMGFRQRLSSGLVDFEEVRMEIRAQFRRFEEVTGKRPTHVDSHQHARAPSTHFVALLGRS